MLVQTLETVTGYDIEDVVSRETGRSLTESLALCVLPFVLPDLCKGALALAISRPMRGRL